MVIAYIRQEGVSPFSVDVLVFKRGGAVSLLVRTESRASPLPDTLLPCVAAAQKDPSLSVCRDKIRLFLFTVDRPSLLVLWRFCPFRIEVWCRLPRVILSSSF